MPRVLAGILLIPFVLPVALGAQDAPTRPLSSSKTSLAKPSALEPGAITDGVYRSSSLGFSYKIPFGWVERTQEMQEGSDAGKGLVLLAVFERPPEAAGSTVNSAVVIAAESVSSYPGLKTAADYFSPLTELTTAKSFKVVNQPYEFFVGAKRLVRGDFRKELGALTMHQASLVMLAKGYVISFTFIGGSEDELEGLVERLSFVATGSGGKRAPSK
jgi:hypothetical protein